MYYMVLSLEMFIFMITLFKNPSGNIHIQFQASKFSDIFVHKHGKLTGC